MNGKCMFQYISSNTKLTLYMFSEKVESTEAAEEVMHGKVKAHTKDSRTSSKKTQHDKETMKDTQKKVMMGKGRF